MTAFIDKGRFSLLPGLGIYILRVGLDFPVSFNRPASLRRAAGDSDFIPSTPAVFLPWFSTVTRRTAKYSLLAKRLAIM